MRRDHFSLEVSTPTGDEHDIPTLVVAFEGSTRDLLDPLAYDGEAAVDVAFRLLADVDDEDATGVLGVTDRVTGEFILELNAPASEITAFVRAARIYREEGDADRYRLVIRADDEELFALEKQTFLVYDQDGGLLRGHSLIPSGVEL